MVPTTRRRFLYGTTAFVAALTGCNESRGPSTPSEPRRTENVERDPEAHVVRSASDEPTAWLRRESPTDDSGTTDADDANTPPTSARVAAELREVV